MFDTTMRRRHFLRLSAGSCAAMPGFGKAPLATLAQEPVAPKPLLTDQLCWYLGAVMVIGPHLDAKTWLELARAGGSPLASKPARTKTPRPA